MKKIILSLGLCLAFSQCLHAQWTSGTANNTYTTNTANNVVIGNALPTTINASSLLFPSSTPKLEILSGAAGTTYSELVTLRHTGISADPVSRQMGIVFKLSGEATAAESNKMGGMIVESSGPWANNPTLSLVTNNIRRLFIDYNGNTGVGTTAPISMLDVNGNIAVAATAGLCFNSYWSGDWKYRANGFGNSMYQTSTGDFVFATMSNNTAGVGAIGTPNLRMTILNNGNVGIGTIDPKGNKLAVNGSVIATEVTVQPYGSWPDYVFKKDYQLRSLSEVKAYIDQNQHLPEIPSAAEVDKNGLKLGEINKLLMKKVEELTLYLIEQNKQISEQNKKMSDQQKINESLQLQIDQMVKKLK